ncbi:MAG: hypothetical protein K0R57_20 [Paenibacillaceae bacterium]|jgi:hypothetical protein|nr:hypothetical protein [Paenibacillaceae bacterium]
MDLNTEIILIGLLAAVVLLLVFCIILTVRINRINRRYRKIVGNTSIEHVDDLLISLQEKVGGLLTDSKQQADTIASIREVMKKMKANVAVKRYNAFSQQGSDLSFSVAILDEEQEGLVITAIHNREDSYLYAKPVHMGESTYTLSPEEKEVIVQAAEKKQSSPHRT